MNGGSKMVIRQISANQWEYVYGQITKYGKSAPLSLQFDVDVNCNGVDYVLKLQPEKNRKIVALQATSVYRDGEGTGDRNYQLIDDNLFLSALIEIIIFQGLRCVTRNG